MGGASSTGHDGRAGARAPRGTGGGGGGLGRRRLRGEGGRQRRLRGQRAAGLERGALGLGLGRGPGERVEGEAQAGGRIARQQHQAAAAQHPLGGGPAARLGAEVVQRHDPRRGHADALVEGGHGRRPTGLVGHRGVVGGDVVGRGLAGGRAGLVQQVDERILERRVQEPLGQAQAGGERDRQRAGLGEGGGAGRERIGEDLGVRPQVGAVGAPVDAQLPAGQGLARVPLALAGVEQATRGEALGQAAGELPRLGPLVVAVGADGPLHRVHVVDRHERGLAALGEAHVAGHQAGVDRPAHRVDALPLVVGVRERDPRVLVHPGDRVGEVEGDLARLGGTGDGRGRRGPGRGRQRDVPLPREQPGGGVEAHPAGAGEEDLAPGVEVGEVGRGARRAVEGLLVGDELHEVARHEPGGEAEVAQDLHEQPAAVAARAQRLAQGDLRVLHARLHAGRVGDVALEPLVDGDQEVDRRGALGRHGDLVEPALQHRADGVALEVRAEVAEQLGVVGERDRLGLGLEEEVERVDDGEVGDEVDHDRELGGLLGEDEAGLEVAERVLLPVHEVVARLDGHRVGEDRGAAVRRGPQSDHVRREADGAIEQVAGAVLERDVDAHGEAASVPVPGK